MRSTAGNKSALSLACWVIAAPTISPWARIGGNLCVVTLSANPPPECFITRACGIPGAHPCFALLGLLARLARSQLSQFFQRALQPLLPLAPRADLGLLGFRAGRFVPRIAHLRHALPRPLQVRLDRRFALKTSGAGQRLDLGAVLHHLFQRNQPFFAERRQNLGEQFIQLSLLLHPEIGQRVVVHFLQPRQPLERRIVLAAPRHFPRRTNSWL